MSGQRTSSSKKKRQQRSEPSQPAESLPPEPQPLDQSPPHRAAADVAAARIARGEGVIGFKPAKPKRKTAPVTPVDEDEGDSSPADSDVSDSTPTPAELRRMLGKLGKLLSSTKSRNTPMPTDDDETEGKPKTKQIAQPNFGNIGASGPSSTSTIGAGSTVNVHIGQMAPEQWPPTSSAPDLSATLMRLASHSIASELWQKLPATATEKADAAAARFVELAFFLPKKGVVPRSSPDAVAPDSAATQMATSFLDALLRADPGTVATREKSRLLQAPKFARWDEVLTAFGAGLIPLVCQGRPDRLVDYLALQHALTIEYACGRPWPVLLRYIEMLRRKVLQSQHPKTHPEAEKARHDHRLTLSINGDRLLDQNILDTILGEWSNNEIEKFTAESVDDNAIRALLAKKFAMLGDTSAGRPTPAAPSHVPAPPTPTVKTARDVAGLTQTELDKLKKMPNPICIKFLTSGCPHPCPNGRLHKTKEEAKQLL